MRAMTAIEFTQILESGPYAWPGGYPLYFIMADGEPLSFKAAIDEKDRILTELEDKCDPAWRPVAHEVNWEDGDLYCAHSNERIESAYEETEPA
jgi:hypothetical protein